jgi:hypothetical protein
VDISGARWWGGDLAPIQRSPVALHAGLELRELAVGGALRAPGHLPARGESQVGFRDPEGCFVVVAPLVEGGAFPLGSFIQV